MIARKEDHMFDKDLDEDLLDNETDDGDAEGGEDSVVLAVPTPSVADLHVNPATPLDLARLGLSEIAYIRRAIVNDVPMWTIHSAAGDPLGAAHSFDQAWAAVRQNDLEPVRVH
jgi:hypothetical protein